jgi:tetratricopeptide (TPR) repeat protein
VKQEIYRLPDRLIYYLGLIHGVQGDGSWNTLDKLCELSKISLEGANNLKKALTFATNLRLKTYDHYGHQKETMDFSKSYNQNQTESEELIEAISDTFMLKREDLKSDGALFEYYKVVLPLHKKLEEFCTGKDIENKDNFFTNKVFYSNSPGTLAAIHLRLLQYEAALEQELLELEELKATFDLEHLDVARSLNNLGVTYVKLGNHQEALRYGLEALELKKKVLGQEHPDITKSLNNVGYTYGELGNHQEDLRYQLEALELSKKVLGQEHPNVAKTLNSVGYTYGALGNRKEALCYLLEALELWKKVLGQEHPNVAKTLNSVGYTYGNLGEHQDALEYLQKALKLAKKLLGEEHPNVAVIYNNFIKIACKEAGISFISISAFIERYEILKEDLSSLNVNVMLFDEFVNLFLFGDSSDFHLS